MQDVIVPALGMAMTEVVLTRWCKQPGDSLDVGDVVAEIETDKSDVELTAASAGVLGHHLVDEGATVPVGAAVVRILAPGEVEETTVPAADAEVVPAPDAVATARLAAPDPESARHAPTGRTPNRLSPRQRRLAQLDDRSADATDTAPDSGQRRSVIARQVEESWRTIPHFSVQREIDAGNAVRALGALRSRHPEGTFTDLLLRALAMAVQDVVASGGDIGLAVATPNGVMMPVVAAVPSLRPSDLVRERIDATRRGREGRLGARDVAGHAVASLSNLGSRGVDAFTGIVPVSQQLLLTVGRVAERPVVVDGAVVARPTIVATVNVDHRALDGDQAAAVLAAFAREFGTLHGWVEGEH